MAICTRTPQEIEAHRASVATGFFDFQGGDLLEWLPFELARPHLKDGVTAEQWATVQESGDPLDKVRDYLPFAWEKANNCRGLSADRSVQHLRAWLWLAGFDVNADFDERYEYYGKPCLVVASELVGFDWRPLDNGEWVNSEDGPNEYSDSIVSSAVDFAKSLQPTPHPTEGAI